MTAAARLIVEARPGVVRAALIDADGSVIEFHEERAHAPRDVGAIYLGRVRALRMDIGCAFVDIGAAADGFLNLSKGHAVREGDAIVVRVTRSAEPGKGVILAAIGDELPMGWDVARLKTVTPPAELLAAPGLAVRLLAEAGSAGLQSVLVDDASLLGELQRFAEAELAEFSGRFERVPSGQAAFEAAGIAEHFEAALSPLVLLPRGGSLLIHETPAMATIDVNAGDAEAGAVERTALATNLEAAAVVARELRRRGIGGLIAVDFLKMRKPENRAWVLTTLKVKFAGDPGEPKVSGFSPFGVVEIARRRLGPSLTAINLRQISEKSPETVALDLIDELRRRGGAKAAVRLHQAVFEQLRGPLAAALKSVEDRLGFKPTFDVRPDWPAARTEID